MNLKKYIEDNFLSSNSKIKYSTIKEDNLLKNHLDFLNELNLTTKYLKSNNMTERMYHAYNHMNDNVVCAADGCMNIPKFDTFQRGYKETCCIKCSAKKSSSKVHQTKLDNNLYTNISVKIKNTIHTRHGSLKNGLIRNKVKETNNKKYGGNAPMCSELIKLKMRNTCLEKYGVENGGLLNSGYNWKDYIMPSGAMLRIQGYENLALDELLQQYDESEIIANKKDIPKFEYILNGKIRKYYPDIFIPKNNLIIEVKSEWILEKHKDINDIKFKSVIDAGYNFKLMIF